MSQAFSPHFLIQCFQVGPQKGAFNFLPIDCFKRFHQRMVTPGWPIGRVTMGRDSCEPIHGFTTSVKVFPSLQQGSEEHRG